MPYPTDTFLPTESYCLMNWSKRWNLPTDRGKTNPESEWTYSSVSALRVSPCVVACLDVAQPETKANRKRARTCMSWIIVLPSNSAAERREFTSVRLQPLVGFLCSNVNFTFPNLILCHRGHLAPFGVDALAMMVLFHSIYPVRVCSSLGISESGKGYKEVPI
jgi:hypothetical protein